MVCPTRLQLDFYALEHNFMRVRELAPQTKILAMVKANAYGHGLAQVTQNLTEADAFGVACLEEAQVVRACGIKNPIVIMTGFVTQAELQQIVNLNCEIVVHTLNQVEALEKIRLVKPINIWLKIDTGMHRLGILPQDVPLVYSRLMDCNNVSKPFKLMTHFAAADSNDKTETLAQIELFNTVTKDLAGAKSLANSAGILSFPEAHADWVRPGGLLYGVSPIVGDLGKRHNLRPVMTLKSHIIALRKCKKGDLVGYGGTWRCPEDLPLGIVATGYGDGYPRHAKSGTPVLVNDHICPLVGRVSMDMLAVDLRSFPQAKIHDEVVLWGEGLPVEHIAEHAATITYELFCGIARRGRG